MSDYLLTGVDDVTECPVPPGTFGWGVYFVVGGRPGQALCLTAADAMMVAQIGDEQGWDEASLFAMTHDGDRAVDRGELRAWLDARDTRKESA